MQTPPLERLFPKKKHIMILLKTFKISIREIHESSIEIAIVLLDMRWLLAFGLECKNDHFSRMQTCVMS